LAPGSRLWLIRDSYAAQTAVLRISAARPGGYRHLAIGDQPGLARAVVAVAARPALVQIRRRG